MGAVVRSRKCGALEAEAFLVLELLAMEPEPLAPYTCGWVPAEWDFAQVPEMYIQAAMQEVTELPKRQKMRIRLLGEERLGQKFFQKRTLLSVRFLLKASSWF